MPASYVKSLSFWQIVESSGQLVAISKEECAAEQETAAAVSISVQPTINFLLKNGIPSYLFVGLWVDNGQTETESKQITLETNYLAQQWTTFEIAADPNFRIELFMGQGDGSDDRRLGMVDSKRVNQAVEQLGKTLATTEIDDLAQGFHIVTIPLKMDILEDLDMARGKGGTMMFTCLASAVAIPDTVQLLRIEDSLLEKTSTSQLQVEAWKVLNKA